MSDFLFIGWIIVTVLIFSWVAYVLHKGDQSSHVKTTGFLGTVLVWFLASAVVIGVVGGITEDDRPRISSGVYHPKS